MTDLTNKVLRSPERRTLKPRPSLIASHLQEPRLRPLCPPGSRRVYGDFGELGISLELHHFEPIDRLVASHGFYPESLELCLNVLGNGSVILPEQVLEFQPLTAGFYLVPAPLLSSSREPGQRHRFVTIAFSRSFLHQHLACCDGSLHPLVDQFIRGRSTSSGSAGLRPLTMDQERLIAHFHQPPAFQGARNLWYQSRVLQLMVEFFFQSAEKDELFCDRQKRVARQRVDKVVSILRRSLAEPPSLERIGREAGCSPFHLSRTFSQETGLTIPQYLRQLRMERAAELLRAGTCNVTEAALEVGYSSLSHFTTAFRETFGCCPGLFPLSTSSSPALPRSALPRASS
jgi:AraC-like DNA-binding protein